MNIPTIVETVSICLVWALLCNAICRTKALPVRKPLSANIAAILIDTIITITAYLCLNLLISRVIAYVISVVILCVVKAQENQRYSTELALVVVLSGITSYALQVTASIAVALIFRAINMDQPIVVVQILKTTAHLSLGLIASRLLRKKAAHIMEIASSYALGFIAISGALFILAYEVLQERYLIANRALNQFAIIVAAFSYALAVYISVHERKRKMELERLREEIRSLAAQIHKTKESIPACHTRLLELKCIADSLGKEALSEELSSITAEFADLSEDIHLRGRQEFLTHPLPATGVKIIDAQLANEQRYASSYGINFDCTVITPLVSLLGICPVKVVELQQMIGDMIRNAVKQIDSTGHADKQIQVFFGDTPGGYCIQVYDTAHYFQPDILARIGERGVTTNGTGNGLPDIIETLAPYGASLVIEEYAAGTDDFTKSVSILFDGAAQVRVGGITVKRIFPIR